MAQKYENYVNKYPRYRKTSQFLVKLAGIKKGMIVVDLCCGTGVAIKEILKKTGNSGKIICVDRSKEMLAIAKKEVGHKNISFIQSSGEEIDKTIKEKVDAVLCNSAFWHMNMDKTLLAIRNILKDDGKFVFNFPNFIYDIDAFINPKASFFSIIRKILIEKMLADNHFKIDSYKILELKRTVKDQYEFYKIPIILPHLKYPERLKIVNEAYRQVDKNNEIIDKWLFLVVKKSD